MAKITRSSGKGVRRAAKSQSRAAGARRAKAQTSSMLDRAMGLLPFSDEQWSTIWMTVIIGAGVGLAFVIANLAGVPALAQAQVAAMASDAGFEVKHVRVTGTSRMDERQVYARALAQRDLRGGPGQDRQREGHGQAAAGEGGHGGRGRELGTPRRPGPAGGSG